MLLPALCANLLLAQAPLRAGDPAPRAEVVTLEGKRLTLEPDGRVTIVDFFATWCGPCRASLAGHERILAAHGERVRIIVVDVEEPAPVVRDFFRAHPLPAGVVLVRDPTGAVMRSFGPKTTFPTMYVFDQGGILRNRLRGWGARSPQTMLRWLGALLAAPDRNAAATHDERARRMGVEVVR